MRDGPTRRIFAFARSQPGGVIRWREARDIYVKHSKAAQYWCGRGGPYHFHMALGKLLKAHFTKVEGVDGYYVLSETIRRVPNDPCEICGSELNDDDSCPSWTPPWR